ncbi:unnamed protein product [Clonostachys rosea]|uniref:2EXR domain-containing protein n=1 Tax=Bionectria ochroleuca TaxID=29856 RepID=A0ABY6TZV2_BIOOC|nr:unnamed protein product [Clonostachys rosea]
MSHLPVVFDDSSDSEADRASSEVESESESDGSPVNQLIDLEAVESDESSDESSSTLGHDDDGDDESQPNRVFTKFNDLPPELRRQIWEAFCPDLVSEARLLSIQMQWISRQPRDFAAYWKFEDGIELADQTEALRAVSAVNRESREIVLRLNPDTLHLDAGSGDAEVRFKKDRDIVLFNGLDTDEELYAPYGDGLCDNVLHAAFPLLAPFTAEQQLQMIEHFIRALPNLKTVFISRPHSEIGKKRVRWCGSRNMRYARIETYEKQPGLGEDLEWVYCWPDLDKRWDEATRRVIDEFPNQIGSTLADTLEQLGVKLAPMVCFESFESFGNESGIEYFDNLVKRHDLGNLHMDDEEESSSESEEEEEEPDEYESEGIDDAEIISNDSDSEDELIPNPISPGGSPDPGNFSSAEEDSDVVVARFSSPEQDALDDEEEGEEDLEPAPRIPKRRIVSDSEDEDDEPRSKRVRTQTTVVNISSDEEDEAPRGASQRSRAGRGTQVISSDSESGSENNDTKKVSENEDSQSESEDDDEDDKPPARLSLAERLRLHREENPVGLSDEDNSEVDSQEGGSFINDDDEDEDEFGDGLLDDIAELSEGEGEGDDSEDGW